jgi:hypothetical protein
MKTNQRWWPDRGYTAPKKTRHACTNPAFADKRLHRVGLFSDGKLTLEKCVNCGVNFERILLVSPA